MFWRPLSTLPVGVSERFCWRFFSTNKYHCILKQVYKLNRYFRSLQQPCHILIAIQSFCEIFHQAAHPITAYFIYTGKYFIAVRECLYLQFVSNIFMQLAAFLILSIGVDRIFCVCFSIWSVIWLFLLGVTFLKKIFRSRQEGFIWPYDHMKR